MQTVGWFPEDEFAYWLHACPSWARVGILFIIFTRVRPRVEGCARRSRDL